MNETDGIITLLLIVIKRLGVPIVKSRRRVGEEHVIDIEMADGPWLCMRRPDGHYTTLKDNVG